jgi:hypothetical protein
VTRHFKHLLGPLVSIECDRCNVTVPYVAEDGFPQGWGRRANPPYPVFDLDLCPDCVRDWPPDVATGDGYA